MTFLDRYSSLWITVLPACWLLYSAFLRLSSLTVRIAAWLACQWLPSVICQSSLRQGLIAGLECSKANPIKMSCYLPVIEYVPQKPWISNYDFAFLSPLQICWLCVLIKCSDQHQCFLPMCWICSSSLAVFTTQVFGFWFLVFVAAVPGQPGIILGCSVNWRRKAQSFLFLFFVAAVALAFNPKT